MWATDRIRRRLPRGKSGEHDVAILLTEPSQGRQVVARACQIAQSNGVRRGIDLAQARALLGDRPVEVRPHQPEQDRAALSALARWALRFSPVVAPDPPDGLLIDIAGCQRLFRGEPRMMRGLVQAVQRMGFRGARAAVGPTFGCAWAVARFGVDGAIIAPGHAAQALEPLPVRGLRITPQIEAALADVAIDRIGDLMHLPREELAERFGAGLLRRLDEALGRVHEVLEPIRPAIPLRVEREFIEPVGRFEAVELVVQELLSDFSALLERHGRGARRVVLRMHRVDAAAMEQCIELTRPMRDPRRLWKLLAPKVEKLDIGYGIERFILESPSSGKMPHIQPSAWPEESLRPDESISELLDLMVNRLGPARVCRAELVETHTPEKSFEFGMRNADCAMAERVSRACPRLCGDMSSATPSVEDGGADFAMAPDHLEHSAIRDLQSAFEFDRPSVLLDPAEPVRVVVMAPEGPVVSLNHRGRALRIIGSLGPERIAPRWWLTGAEARTAPARDYFKLQDEHGRWWWIYRKAETSKWFVQGMWA